LRTIRLRYAGAASDLDPLHHPRVRREGVNNAAGKLQNLGVIQYARGEILVLDRPKLEELSCECYAVVKKENDRLRARHASPLGGQPPIAA
jgi:hypothetical protein